MEKRKVLNLAIVFLLVASTFTIFYIEGVAAQGEDGEIYSTNDEGGGQDNFIEGSELYFTIELEENEEVEVTVSFRDEVYSLIENKVVTTDATGSYISSNEGVYFDLTNRRAGEYHLNITSPDGDYDQATITIQSNYSRNSEINTWNTEERNEERTRFTEGIDVHFDGVVMGAHQDEVLSNGETTIQLFDEDAEEGYHSEIIITDDEGEFEGAFEWGLGFFDPDPPDPGDYSLEVIYEYDDLEEQVIASRDILVYEPEVSQESSVITTEDNYETEKDYFMEDEIIYFRADMIDQHGWPLVEEPEITVLIEKEGEEVNTAPDNIDPAFDDGSLFGYFELDVYEIGDYILKIVDTHEDIEYATSEFTVDVPKYSLEVETNKYVYLPGEDVNAFYTVEDLIDGSQYTDVDVEWMMEYETEEGEDEIETGEGTDGEFEFTLPDNAAVTSEFDIIVWANDTGDEFQDREVLRRYVGDLNLDLDVKSDEYFVGQTLYIELHTSAHVFIGGQPQPIASNYAADIEVDVELLDDDDNEVYEKTGVTGGGGYYMLTMDLSGIEPGDYLVVGNANWNDMEDDDEDDFVLKEESEKLSVMLERDKGENPYHPGEEGSIVYIVTRRGETVTDDANVKYTLYSDQRIFDRDFARDGEIAFEVPSDYSPSSDGDLWMYVEANIDREVYGDSIIRIPVSIGEILLNPSQWEYEAGDQMNFEYEFHMIGIDEIDSLEYRILDPNDEIIISGTPSGGVFEIIIPENPRRNYRVELEAVTEGGESLETVEWIFLVSGFDLNIEIITDSDYTTGVYQAGEEIEIYYDLVPRDGDPLPETVRVSYEIVGHPEIYSFRTNETEGTFTLTLPNLNDGEHILNIEVYEIENSEIIEVDNNPWWGNRIILGNGSVSGVIIIILIIIALIISGLALYRTRSRGFKGRRKIPQETQKFERHGTPPRKEKGGTEFNIEEEKEEQKSEWSGIEQKSKTNDEIQKNLEE